MRRHAILALLSFGVAVGGGPSLAAPPGRVRTAKAAIQLIYNAQNAAMAARNIKGVMWHRAPAYSVTLPGGQVSTRAQVQKHFEGGMKSVKSPHSVTTIAAFILHGNTATVVMDQRFTATMLPGHGPSGKVAIHNRNRDTWAHTRNGWMLEHSTMLKQDITLNGKPMRFSAPPPGSTSGPHAAAPAGSARQRPRRSRTHEPR